MAVAINLVPQEKQTQIQDDRKKKLAFSLILLVNGGLIGLTIVLFLIVQGQNFAIGRVTDDIKKKHEEFSAIPNVKEIVTLQQNLAALPGLYRTRAVYTRFLSVFEDVAPTRITLSNLSSAVDGELEVTGTAPEYRLVTKLTEAMEANGNFENIEIRSAAGEDNTITFNISATASADITAVGGGK